MQTCSRPLDSKDEKDSMGQDSLIYIVVGISQHITQYTSYSTACIKTTLTVARKCLLFQSVSKALHQLKIKVSAVQPHYNMSHLTAEFVRMWSCLGPQI